MSSSSDAQLTLLATTLRDDSVFPRRSSVTRSIWATWCLSLQYMAMSQIICVLTAPRSLLWMVCVALLAIGWSSVT